MVSSIGGSTYEELEALRESLSKEVESRSAALKEAQENLAAVTLAIKLLKGSPQKTSEKSAPDSYLKEFRGLTQLEGLAKIAKDSGKNRVKLAEAKKILLDAGLIKSKKNAYGILSTAVKRSGKFKRVAPGEYEPIPENATMQVVRATIKPADDVMKRFIRSSANER